MILISELVQSSMSRFHHHPSAMLYIKYPIMVPDYSHTVHHPMMSLCLLALQSRKTVYTNRGNKGRGYSRVRRRGRIGFSTCGREFFQQGNTSNGSNNNSRLICQICGHVGSTNLSYIYVVMLAIYTALKFISTIYIKVMIDAPQDLTVLRPAGKSRVGSIFRCFCTCHFNNTSPEECNTIQRFINNNDC